MTFDNLFKILLVLSCEDAKQFGTSEGDKSQKRGDKSRQPYAKPMYLLISAVRTARSGPWPLTAVASLFQGAEQSLSQRMIAQYRASARSQRRRPPGHRGLLRI
jgi:hypothetical protein